MNVQSPEILMAIKAKEDLNSWRKTTINLAISGATTADKYKFISILTNSNLAEMNECEEYNILAPVKPKPYFHSNNSNFTVWDLPECYFSNKSDYLNSIEVNKYDLFFIFNSNNSDQIDLWLAKDLIELKKKVFFIKNYPNFVQSPLDNLIETIQVVEANQHEYSLESDNVYLVSPNIEDRNSLDFINLLMDVMKSLSSDKMEALALTLEPFSKEIVHTKYLVLKSKTFYSAFASSILGISTVLEASICIDLALITNEIWFFIQQFGLEFENIDKLETLDASGFDKIISSISKYEYGSFILLNNIQNLSDIVLKIFKELVHLNSQDLVEFFPQIAQILNDSWAFSATRFALCSILDDLARISADIIDFQTKRNQD
jgi:hypothetical protein